MTANDDLLDGALRHQVHVRRLASGEVNKMLDLLEAADRDVVKLIREGLKAVRSAGGDPLDRRNLRRLEAMLKEIKRERERLLTAIEAGVEVNMIDLAGIEASFEARLLKHTIPIEITLPVITPAKLRAIATEQPFAGRALGDWWQGLRTVDQVRVLEQTRIGFLEGQSIPDIAKRIGGTRALKFRDGVLAVTRRQAEAIVRTAVNGISNAARLETLQGLGDGADALVWTATLDGRTSDICRARDGHVRAVSEGRDIPDGIDLPRLTPPFARPPAHVSCRSTLVAVISGAGLIGDRPFVTDTRTRRRREIDFRAEARQEAGTDWRNMSRAERTAAIRARRNLWSDANIGRIPATTDYDTFLRRQPEAFQDDVLGKTRGKLFRKGGLKQDQFVDFNGDTLTLDELRALHPDAFERAGV